MSELSLRFLKPNNLFIIQLINSFASRVETLHSVYRLATLKTDMEELYRNRVTHLLEVCEEQDEQLDTVQTRVERFGRRGIEPNELFRSEFGQNSWNSKKTTKRQHFFEVAADPKDTTGPQEKREKGNKLH